MKVHADWRDIAGSAAIAALIALVFGPNLAFRLGAEDSTQTVIIGFVGLLLFFLWPLFRDFALALYRVLSVRSSTGTRANVSIPAAHRTRRIPSGVRALSDGRDL
jgi:multisubunit Na+/H+ antiporter MnhF subunit